MSESRTIRFYHADDWVWVYADDRLILSEHSCTGKDLLRALDYEDVESKWFKADVDEQDIWNIAHGPEDHAEFPTELFE